MAQLQELLKEEQEPFVLRSYISDRRSQIKRPSPNTTLQLRKRKPLHQNSFPVNLCKNACLFASSSSSSFPTETKSPLFELASPSPACRSPSCKSPIFLHIPSRTAALLLEAALRIHKSSKTKSQTKTKSNGFGLFGSFFKRLTNRKRETESNATVKDLLKLDSPVERRKVLHNGSKKEQANKRVSQRHRENKNNKNGIVGNASACEVGFRCSYNGRASSVFWSESNEDKSLDMETSTSTNSSHSYDGDDDSDDEIVDFVMSNHKHDADCSCSHHHTNAFCQSPFRFVLQRSPSSGRNTPELASPATSPTRHRTQDKESKNGAESLNKFQTGEEEEEDKEQCSPVSVLDPPFEDDDEGHGNDDDDDHDEEEEDQDGFDLECSYAIVQRAKQQLLYKLRRFEKLAGLDPVELEKTMLDEDDTFMEEGDYEDDEDSDEASSCKENDLRELVIEALCKSSVHDRLQIPELGLKKLVSDLIVEERGELIDSLEDRDMVVRRVCKRLELWKEVEPNTIDMMIEEDFSREDVVWKKNVDQMRDMAGELELAIFGFLVEEFSEELEC